MNGVRKIVKNWPRLKSLDEISVIKTSRLGIRHGILSAKHGLYAS